MNSLLDNAMEDFNKFKHEKEYIYTFKTFKGKWSQIGAFLVITADYEDDDKDNSHIHYCNKFFGSDKFNQWLRKYDFNFIWFDNTNGYCFLKMLFD